MQAHKFKMLLAASRALPARRQFVGVLQAARVAHLLRFRDLASRQFDVLLCQSIGTLTDPERDGAAVIMILATRERKPRAH